MKRSQEEDILEECKEAAQMQSRMREAILQNHASSGSARAQALKATARKSARTEEIRETKFCYYGLMRRLQTKESCLRQNLVREEFQLWSSLLFEWRALVESKMAKEYNKRVTTPPLPLVPLWSRAQTPETQTTLSLTRHSQEKVSAKRSEIYRLRQLSAQELREDLAYRKQANHEEREKLLSAQSSKIRESVVRKRKVRQGIVAENEEIKLPSYAVTALLDMIRSM
eukprot:PhF_6_TR22478/c0_g1_i1/m.31871